MSSESSCCSSWADWCGRARPSSSTGEGTENWIVPVGLLAAMAVGAAVTIALPALARAGASTGRRALTGGWWGLLASFAGIVVFWFLLNGPGGA